MKIICTKSNLVKGVSIVSKAVPSKTTMPILECILIDATTDVVKLTANDMELGIETSMDGDIVERGIIALNAKIFSEIVRKLPDNEVTIETESDNQALITCEKAKFSIAAQSGDDFSYLPAIESNDFITVSEFTLKEAIRQTIFSIADNDTNKMMTGELFEITEKVLKVVSLDGHRISIRKIELKDFYEPRKVIVPGKTLQEISKIIGGEAEAEVQISFTKNHIVFEFDRTVVVSRLIEGEYFRIDQMLSSDYETKVRVNKRELLDCIDRATLLIKEGDKKPIIIDIKDDAMQMMIKSPIMAVWAIIKILGKSWELSAVTAAFVLVICVTIFTVMSICIPRFRIVQKLTDQINRVARENLTGINVVHAFNAEQYQNDKFNKPSLDMMNVQVKNQKLFALVQPTMMLGMNGLSLTIYWLGAALVNKIALTDAAARLTMFSDVLVFSTYATYVVMSFMMLVMIFMLLPQAQVSAERINEVLERKAHIREGGVSESREQGTVEFKNVSFRYPHASEDELSNISFRVEKGETLILIDKHAAHERINFDRLRQSPADIPSQTLLEPLPFTPDASDADVLQQYGDVLAELGFTLEPFGRNDYILRGVPAQLDAADALPALEEICAQLRHGAHMDAQSVRDEVLKTVACKAAIKAGWQTEPEELLRLADAVCAGEVKYCPHGRPVAVTLTRRELDKLFKRIV